MARSNDQKFKKKRKRIERDRELARQEWLADTILAIKQGHQQTFNYKTGRDEDVDLVPPKLRKP